MEKETLSKKVNELEEENGKKSQEPVMDPAIVNELNGLRDTLLKELKLKNSKETCSELFTKYNEGNE